MEKKIIPVALLVLSLVFIPILQKSAFAETIIYNNTVENNGSLLCGTNDCNIFQGEEITASSSLIGATFSEITILLRKNGSPTGTGVIGIWDSTVAPTGGNAIQVITTFNVASLTTTVTEYSFTFSGYSLTANDAVGVLYAGGDLNNWITTRYSTTNQVDGVNTRETHFQNSIASWVDVTTNDLTGVWLRPDGFQIGRCPVGTVLDCVSGTGGALATFSGGQNPTTTVHTIGSGLGILNSTNTDAETNGSGLIMYLMTGSFFSITVISAIGIINRKTGANISFLTTDMAIFWLFLIVAVTAFAFYVNWIPDIIFYGMLVGIAGLTALIFKDKFSRS